MYTNKKKEINAFNAYFPGIMDRVDNLVDEAKELDRKLSLSPQEYWQEQREQQIEDEIEQIKLNEK